MSTIITVRTRPIIIAGLLMLVCLAASCSTATPSATRAPATPAPTPPKSSATPVPATPSATPASASTTVWLCRPGMADDPCTVSLATTQVAASGAPAVVRPEVASTAGEFDCFYAHPRVGPLDSAQLAATVAEAARFSQVCRVWAVLFDESPDPGPGGIGIADSSVQAAFADYLAHDNDGRPIIFIGHSEGSATLITLLSKLVDTSPALRSRMVLTILLGGNVEVPVGKITGGTFSHIQLCTSQAEAGCVIAYSSFPGTPPPDSMFGRPGEGFSLTTGQSATSGMEVACVNPADISGGTVGLDPIFPTGTSSGASFSGPAVGSYTTPWVTYPGLYKATCEHGDGATWLQVTKATGSSDHRWTVTEVKGPTYGYHHYDVNLALGNLVADVAAAESTWSHH